MNAGLRSLIQHGVTALLLTVFLLNVHLLSWSGAAVQPRQLESQNSLSESPRTRINFGHEPAKFAQQVADCLLDKSCFIYYLHIGKTGGTSVEHKFWNMLDVEPPGAGTFHDSCCNSLTMERFAMNTSRFCDTKFKSYQVNGPNFESCVDRCMALPTADGSELRRSIVLVSFREPIGRAVSHIHQMCNKNIDKRTPHVLAACRDCNYSNDRFREFWDVDMVGSFNRMYSELEDVLTRERERVQVLSIDSVFLDSFFDLLLIRLPPSWRLKRSNQAGHKNKERRHLCDFSMHSSMVKALDPSTEIYRNITMGVM